MHASLGIRYIPRAAFDSHRFQSKLFRIPSIIPLSNLEVNQHTQYGSHGQGAQLRLLTHPVHIAKVLSLFRAWPRPFATNILLYIPLTFVHADQAKDDRLRQHWRQQSRLRSRYESCVFLVAQTLPVLACQDVRFCQNYPHLSFGSHAGMQDPVEALAATHTVLEVKARVCTLLSSFVLALPVRSADAAYL